MELGNTVMVGGRNITPSLTVLNNFRYDLKAQRVGDTNAGTVMLCAGYEEHPNMLAVDLLVPEEGARDYILNWVYGAGIDCFYTEIHDDKGNKVFETKHVVDSVLDWSLQTKADDKGTTALVLTVTFSTTSTLVINNGEIGNGTTN